MSAAAVPAPAAPEPSIHRSSTRVGRSSTRPARKSTASAQIATCSGATPRATTTSCDFRLTPSPPLRILSAVIVRIEPGRFRPDQTAAPAARPRPAGIQKTNHGTALAATTLRGSASGKAHHMRSANQVCRPAEPGSPSRRAHDSGPGSHTRGIPARGTSLRRPRAPAGVAQSIRPSRTHSRFGPRRTQR